MNKALFAALASVALLGASCSCSVKDFAPVVLDDFVSTVASFSEAEVLSAPLRAAPSDSKTLEEAQYMSALWIGNPQAESYYGGDSFQPVLRMTGVYSGSAFSIWTAPSNHEIWNRLYIADGENLVVNRPYLVNGLFGGNADLLSNRDVVIYFKEPMHLTWIYPGDRTTHFNNDFRVPASQSGYDAGYSLGSTYEIARDLSRFEFNYYTGSGDDEERHSIVKTDGEAVSYINSYVINGLVSFRGVVDDLTSGVSDAHDIVARFQYSTAKDIVAAPLYIDYEALTSTIAQEFRSKLAVYRSVVQTPWYVFNADLDVGYQGSLSGYPSASLSDRYTGYTHIQINYPMPDVGARLNYIGILSGYAQGYADGVSSRDGEVEDLTERILGLEDDLFQYQGKTYQQIYNSGYQAGLDEENQGARTFNSLFGNILTAPLTILNGVSDISFFGMPILTAILSLLMVALALFLFKRFK